MESTEKVEVPVIGQHVVYVDEVAVEHEALVTAVFGNGQYGAPSVNVVYVSGDESQHDPYGRQIARQTSCVHRSQQAAPGRYWR